MLHILGVCWTYTPPAIWSHKPRRVRLCFPAFYSPRLLCRAISEFCHEELVPSIDRLADVWSSPFALRQFSHPQVWWRVVSPFPLGKRLLLPSGVLILFSATSAALTFFTHVHWVCAWLEKLFLRKLFLKKCFSENFFLEEFFAKSFFQ